MRPLRAKSTRWSSISWRRVKCLKNIKRSQIRVANSTHRSRHLLKIRTCKESMRIEAMWLRQASMNLRSHCLDRHAPSLHRRDRPDRERESRSEVKVASELEIKIERRSTILTRVALEKDSCSLVESRDLEAPMETDLKRHREYLDQALKREIQLQTCKKMAIST